MTTRTTKMLFLVLAGNGEFSGNLCSPASPATINGHDLQDHAGRLPGGRGF